MGMFQEKMAGDGNDSDDLIIQAFKTWGDKMTQAEIDDIFGEFDIDEDYMVKTKEVLGLFVAQKEEEKKEEAPPVEEAAPAAEEDDGEAKKKKKKKKKAAKLPSQSCVLKDQWQQLHGFESADFSWPAAGG